LGTAVAVEEYNGSGVKVTEGEGNGVLVGSGDGVEVGGIGVAVDTAFVLHAYRNPGNRHNRIR
jgi:hypothetical protein